MAFIHEIQVITNGYVGAPGYSNFYFTTTVNADRQDQFLAVHAFIDGIRSEMPAQWSAQISSVGRVLEETTGVLAEFDAPLLSAADSVAGSRGASFGAGVAGVVLGWQTATINRGRLVRGRTFLVPVAAGVFTNDGRIEPAALSAFQTHSDAFIEANVGFGVWSRPRNKVGGLLCHVTSMHMSNSAAFLTSRRG